MTKRLYPAFAPEALQREGLPEQPAEWEDGRRAEARPGFYERWQFNASFADGSLVKITFFSKPLLEHHVPIKPGVSITIVPPDGKPLVETGFVAEGDFSTSKERCYVRAGESWVRGDPQWRYELHVKAGDLAAHLNLTGSVPAWRPGAGKVYAGDPGQEPAGYFAWLAGIPYGSAEGLLTYQGKIHPVEGSCYHDHRWGSVALNEVFDHWYVGHGQAGDVTLVFLELTGSAAYGQQKVPAFLAARGDHMIASGCANLDLIEGEFQPDPGGRSYPLDLNGKWTGDGQSILFRLHDPQVHDSFSLVDYLPTWRRLVGSILSNPYFFSFSAGLDLQTVLAGRQNRVEGQALYELAQFQ